MATDNTNFMDKFFPKLGVMTRFWLFGLLLAAVGGLILWLNDAPESVTGVNASSNFITSASGFIALWIGYVVFTAVLIGIFNSESVKKVSDLNSTDGAGSTKLKQGPIMAGIFLVLITIFTVAYTILSIQHM